MRISRLFLSIVALLLLTAKSGLACACIKTPSLEESFRDADVIFLGRVTDIDSGGLAGVRLDVEKSWKGVSPGEAVVVDNHTPCSLSFTRGERYVVFARQVPGGKYSEACSRTSSVAYAGDQLAYLQDKATIPPPVAPEDHSGSKDYRRLGVATAVFVSLFVGIGLLLKRLFRRAA